MKIKKKQKKLIKLKKRYEKLCFYLCSGMFFQQADVYWYVFYNYTRMYTILSIVFHHIKFDFQFFYFLL